MGKSISTGAMAGITGGIAILGSIFGAISAGAARKAAALKEQRLTAELTHLEDTRQEIINPYATTTNLSSMLSNPFASLSVATQAAEMQMEQTDIALANTLDTLRASGSSAGGATALAQAALQSKQGITASIEAQEVNNEKLKAQGEATLDSQKLAEGQRIQNAEAAGANFMFQTKEGREMQKMDRVAGQLDGARAEKAQAQADLTGAITGGIGAVTGIGSGFLGGN